MGFHELIEPLLERDGIDVRVVANRLDPRPGRLARDLPAAGDRAPSAASRASAPTSPASTASSTSATASPTAASRGRRRASSPATASPSTSRAQGVAVRAVRRLPRRRRARSDACSSDPRSRTTSSSRRRGSATSARIGATVWHDGGLHRVVAGREVRITAAEGGVAIEPWSSEAAAEVGTAARPSVRPRRVSRVGGGRRRRSRMVVGSVAGLPADAEPAAVRGARRRDHDAADLAACGGGDPRQPRRALRRPSRRGLGVSDARADPGAAAAALHAARLLACEGRVRPRARALRSRPRRARRARRRRGDRGSDVGSRARPLDCGLVPRAPSRAASRLAGGRPRRAKGGLDVLRCRVVPCRSRRSVA